MDWNSDNSQDFSSVRSLNFNQDFSCIAVGTSHDYKIFNCDPFGKCFDKNDDGGANIIEMLFSTSLIAVVGTGDKPSNSPRRLKIINTKRKSIICELTFPTSVLNVKLNRKRLIVALLDQIYIYDVSCMKLLHTIETTKNLQGIISLSLNDDSVLAYPAPSSNFNNIYSGSSSAGNPLLDVISNDSNLTLSSTQSGNGSGHNKYHSHLNQQTINNSTIVIFDALNLQPINAIVAHKSDLATISLNSEGSLIATASTKGTIIRVFDTKLGRRVSEFRRGMAGTLIHSLNFNLDSTLLCSSSNNQTIHIFKLGGNSNDSLDKNLGKSVSNAGDSESLEEGNELVRTNTGSSKHNLRASTSQDSESSNLLESHAPTSPTDESLINNLLLNKKRSSSLSGMLWNKSKKFSNIIINNYLPQQITSILEPVRHFAFIKLPKTGITSALEDAAANSDDQTANNKNASSDSITESTDKSIGNIPNNYKCIVALSHNSNYVMIATNEGNFYIYNVPLEKGGECVLIKQYSLLED